MNREGQFFRDAQIGRDDQREFNRGPMMNSGRGVGDGSRNYDREGFRGGSGNPNWNDNRGFAGNNKRRADAREGAYLEMYLRNKLRKEQSERSLIFHKRISEMLLLSGVKLNMGVLELEIVIFIAIIAMI
uniref:Uncharacterized protein n=1 Tax=Arundo donax TaxID=35708 RepID=A0A0A9C6T2_ARUDO